MIAIFHDMMHKCMKDNVDCCESKKASSYLEYLIRVFDRCRNYKLRINPLNDALRVSVGKFLGFVVHMNGIDIDPVKVKAIQSMPSPTSQIQLKGLLGKVSYIRRFIPALGEIITLYQSMLKNGVLFV